MLLQPCLGKVGGGGTLAAYRAIGEGCRDMEIRSGRVLLHPGHISNPVQAV